MGILHVIPAVLLAVVCASILLGIARDGRLRRLAEERRGETLCHFARSLDYRRLDTGIMRAAYEGLQLHVGRAFPIRASDDLVRTYGIDEDDVADLAIEIAGSCGRSLEGWEENPYVGRIATVSDLIEFLCAQPGARRP